MSIDVLSPETGHHVYSLPRHTIIYRYEPEDVATPMMPHRSMYAPYGPFEFRYVHLFCAEERALGHLTRLRQQQGYFEGATVLREAVLGDLIHRCGSGTKVLEDIKFNISVVGERQAGALIIASRH